MTSYFWSCVNVVFLYSAAPPASDLPPGLLPNHKASILLFLERVYGVDTQSTFFRILEEAFLPDLRAATTLDSVSIPQAC